MKKSMRQVMKKTDMFFSIESMLRNLREKSYEYYCLAVKAQENCDKLLEQNKRLLKEVNELKLVKRIQRNSWNNH